LYKKKYESSKKKVGRKWGPYLHAESNYADGGKPTSKWLVGGRSSNSGFQKEERSSFNDSKSNQ